MTPKQALKQPSPANSTTPCTVLDPNPLTSLPSTPESQISSDNRKQPTPFQPAPASKPSKPTMTESFALKVPHTKSPIPLAIQQPDTSSAAQQQIAHHTMQHDTPKHPLHNHPINQLNEQPLSVDLAEALAACNWSQLTQLLAEAEDCAVEAAAPTANLHIQATTLPSAAQSMKNPEGQPSLEAGYCVDGWSLAVGGLQQWTCCPLTQVSIGHMSSMGMALNSINLCYVCCTALHCIASAHNFIHEPSRTKRLPFCSRLSPRGPETVYASFARQHHMTLRWTA